MYIYNVNIIMNKYYLEFKTWREGMVDMPGKHMILAETNDYRSRADLNKTIPKALVKDVFFSFNAARIEKFLNENVCACVVAVVLEQDDEQDAIDLIEKSLGPIELEGIMKIDETNKHLVVEKLRGTDDQSPVVH
jgi:hypothetical protein